ncbi:MAG: hypothetical protein QOJ82_1201 [Solirubrobacteraceae bacterium]|jgi:hypothetical protein|nr:hypothetical protein [Solirubrobacteraceae bacterium]
MRYGRPESEPGVRGHAFPLRAGSREQAALGLLLEAHPGLRSVDETLREMTDDSEEFAERDRIENAIRDLVRVGLAHVTAASSSRPTPRCARMT